MKCFEYIRLGYDGTLHDFCALGSIGWEIIAYVDGEFIMKRELLDDKAIKQTREFYSKLK